jgi:hypothetical protein
MVFIMWDHDSVFILISVRDLDRRTYFLHGCSVFSRRRDKRRNYGLSCCSLSLSFFWLQHTAFGCRGFCAASWPIQVMLRAQMPEHPTDSDKKRRAFLSHRSSFTEDDIPADNVGRDDGKVEWRRIKVFVQDCTVSPPPPPRALCKVCF